MKRITIATLSLLIFSLISNAQITKGDWLIGGNASFSSASYSSSIAATYTQTSIQISPMTGYFLIDKLAVGLRPGYSYTKTTTSTNNPTLNTFGIGPFARYYFLKAENRINFFGEANYQHLITKVSHNPSGTSNGFSLLAGPVVYFNSSVGIEFTVGYSVTKYGGDADSRNRALQMGLGLQVHLEKDNK